MLKIVWVFIGLAVATASTGVMVADETLRVNLRDGSSLLIDVRDSTLDWVDIVDDKPPAQRTLRWSEIKELMLVELPAGQQIQKIEKLLTQLSSDDYWLRESAEKQLSDPLLTGAFQMFVRRGLDLEDPEAVFRVRRVLSHLSDYGDETVRQIDEAILQDGSLLTGDTRMAAIEGTRNGRPVRIARRHIDSITTDLPLRSRPQRVPIAVQTFNHPTPEFYGNPAETVLSFETDHRGHRIPIGENVNHAFSHFGLLLATEESGYVQSLKYPFKYTLLDTGARCVCPRDLSNNVDRRLQGTTLITFCSPRKPNLAAGVHKFGVLLEKIEHSRDFVVEAFSASGQMLGMVEASDLKCVFAGFESSELIAKVRIRRNPALGHLAREVDRTYALDLVTFSAPEVIPLQVKTAAENSGDMIVETRRGNTFVTHRLRFDQTQLVIANPLDDEDLTLGVGEIQSIARSAPDPSPESDRELMVQLQDGSIVKTTVADFLQPVDYPQQRLRNENVVGIWQAGHPARLPLQLDFAAGKPVVVFPSCRIIAEQFQWSEQGFRWDKKQSEKRIQDVFLETMARRKEKEKDPDLTPVIDRIDFNESSPVPSLWMAQPQSSTPLAGKLAVDRWPIVGS